MGEEFVKTLLESILATCIKSHKIVYSLSPVIKFPKPTLEKSSSIYVLKCSSQPFMFVNRGIVLVIDGIEHYMAIKHAI